MPNDFQKRNIVTLIIIGVVFILLWFISGITKISMNGNKEEIIIEDAKSEMIDSKVVKEYKTFLQVEEVAKTYIETLINKSTNETYKLLTNSAKKKISKREYKEKMSKYIEENFISKEDNVFYSTDNCLYKLYLVEENSSKIVYLLEIKTLNKDNMLVGIQLNTKSQTYNICYLEI